MLPLLRCKRANRAGTDEQAEIESNTTCDTFPALLRNAQGSLVTTGRERDDQTDRRDVDGLRGR